MTESIWRVAFPIEDELRDALAECLMEAGAGAVVLEPGHLVIYGNADQADRLEAAFALFQRTVALAMPQLAAGASVRSQVPPDYHKAWLERLEPVQLTDRLILCPRGKSPAPLLEGRVLYFEPQPSFGHGEHETTRLIASAIERSLVAGVLGPSPTVLDVGTGTGVLALVALASGAEHVVATDTDPLSIDSALANARLNGFEDRLTLLHGTFPDDLGQFPLVLANIDRNTLARIAAELGARVEPGGLLMLTGILHEDVESIEPLYRAHGFLQRTVESGREFSLLVLRKS